MTRSLETSAQTGGQSNLSPTRRGLMVGLPVAVAASAAPLNSTPATNAERLPIGAEAATLAANVAIAAWPRPKTYVPGMHYLWKGSQLRSLLRSYADIYRDRVGSEPSASHMLSVADVLCDPPDAHCRLKGWIAEPQYSFDRARFPSAWSQARMVELRHPNVQLRRLSDVIT